MTPTRQDINRIKNAVEQVIKNRGQKAAVRKLSHYFKKNTLTLGIKDSIGQALSQIIEGKVEPDFVTSFMALMTLTDAPKLKLTEHQMGCLKSIRKVINDAEESSCEHKFVIVPFFHGGGFCPIQVLPELVCHVCGLNVTILLHMSTESLVKHCGIELPDKLKVALREWCAWVDKDRDTEVLSASMISKDLKSALEKSTQFYGDFSMMGIADKQKLESMSGK